MKTPWQDGIRSRLPLVSEDRVVVRPLLRRV